VTYDETLLEPVVIKTTAISEKLNFTTVIADADWTISATSGSVEVGAGPFVTFVFKVKECATGTTALRLTEANIFAQSGAIVETNTLPLVSTLTILQRPQPCLVSLSVPNRAVETEQTVELPLSIETVGELAWDTLSLTLSATNGVIATIKQMPTATADGVIQVDIPEMHGENLSAMLTLSGSAISANGLPAEVISTTATLTIIVPTPSNAVPPWTNGDCNGDGLVTWDDYDCAMNALMTYHRPVRPTKHTADGEDVKIHNSICSALGYSAGASLTLADGPKFGNYIEQLIGPRSK
jgi:hypothetical protein